MRTLGQFTVTSCLTLSIALSAQAQTPSTSQETPAEAEQPGSEAQSPSDKTKADAELTVKSDAAWEKDRDYTRYRHNSLLGNTGLLHTVSADSGAPGTFRISFLSSYYSGSGFLCPTAARCGVQSGVNGNQDSASRSGADLAISATLLPFLEASAGLHSHASSDNFGSPSVIQVLNDSFVGLKGFMPRTADRVFSAGGLGELRFLNSAGNIEIHTADLALAALGTVDLTNRSDLKQRIPLRFHTNIGYLFDNSSTIATNIERTRPQPIITRIERFRFEINRVDSLFMGIGGEYISQVFQPFVEWTIDVASNRQGFKCITKDLAPGDVCLVRASGLSGTPSRLTVGTRLTPPLYGLSATLAFDIGTSGTSTFTEERVPELPWNLYLGLGYAIDTVAAPPPVVQAPAPRIIRVAPPIEYRIQGTVLDEDTSQPVARAMIQFEGHDYTGLVSRANGTFDSGNVSPGEYKLLVTADGYKDGTCTATVKADTADAKTSHDEGEASNTAVKCSLKPAPALGLLYGTLVDADSSAPVPHAAIKVRDERDRSLELKATKREVSASKTCPLVRSILQFLPLDTYPTSLKWESRRRSSSMLR